MATNRDLLKEAIADAKAVKEMAIANAKSALEEAFTPQLTSMLSARLQEMEEEEDEDVEDVEMTTEGEEEESDDLNLEELLAELEGDEDEDESEEDEMEDEMEDEEEGEALDMEDMTEDDLKTFIEGVIADMVEAGDLEAGEDMEGEEEFEEDEMDEELEEDIDLEELLAEMEMEDEDESDEELEEGIVDFIKDLPRMINRIGSSGAVKDKMTMQLPQVIKAAQQKGLLDSNYKMSEDELKSLEAKIKGDGAGGDIQFKDGKVIYTPGGEIAGTASASTRESLELREAYKVIKTLRSELNEINLLNAKLLYTNKIFKAKNLTESQKMKVLTTFDKASNVKEVKLVFETLNGSFNSSKKPITENRGSASSACGIKAKSPIIQVDDAFKRMTELAFYNVKH